MALKKDSLYVESMFGKLREEYEKLGMSWLGMPGFDNVFALAVRKDLLKGYPDQLSGGQGQRVGIARALAASPDILLMDEPFGAVDNLTRSKLQEEIRQIHDELGLTTLFVTHDISEAFKLATKILIMDEGTAIQYDTPEIIRNTPANGFAEKLLSSTAR